MINLVKMVEELGPLTTALTVASGPNLLNNDDGYGDLYPLVSYFAEMSRAENPYLVSLLAKQLADAINGMECVFLFNDVMLLGALAPLIEGTKGVSVMLAPTVDDVTLARVANNRPSSNVLVYRAPDFPATLRPSDACLVAFGVRRGAAFVSVPSSVLLGLRIQRGRYFKEVILVDPIGKSVKSPGSSWRQVSAGHYFTLLVSQRGIEEVQAVRNVIL
jgi:hypothetical protein